MTLSPTPPPAGADARWAILYDPDCGFCRTALAVILRADRRRQLHPVALGSDDADALLPDLSAAQRMASWHLVSPAGERTSAGAAGPPLLRLLPGGAGPAAVLAHAPAMTERAYEWVVTHRSTLSRLVGSSVKRRAAITIARRSGPPNR